VDLEILCGVRGRGVGVCLVEGIPARNSPSCRPIASPQAGTGRVSQGNGRNGSTKGSLSSTVSGPGSRNASDADVYRSTNASLRTQPTELDARGPGRATGLAETSRPKAYAWCYPAPTIRARDYSSAAGSGCKPYGCSSLQPFSAFSVELALGRPGCKLEDGATPPQASLVWVANKTRN